MPTLAFEIGCEELPHSELESFAAQFSENLRALLKAQRLEYQDLTSVATPRRLGAVVHGLAERQSSAQVERKGPAWDKAFDAAGEPTAAASGFARSCDTTVDKLQRSADGRLLCVQQLPQFAAQEVLEQALATTASALKLKKSMRWNLATDRFSRPIRWLLALLDDQVLKLEVAGCAAGNSSYGHRLIHPQPVPIDHADAYLGDLRTVGKVVATAAQRSELIEQQVAAICSEHQLSADLSGQLLTTITNLVELPDARLCSFPEHFLELPDKLLRSVLIEHQKYIPLNYSAGKLSNYFIAVSNNPEGDGALISKGHERVVRPRLEDAWFFWSKDKDSGLVALAERLPKLVFARGLGSMHDKSQRHTLLLQFVAADLPPAQQEHLQQAARLAKADLLSNLVQEFPELQAYAGARLAQAAGMAEELCSAIAQQYQPSGREDAIPTMPAALLALVDKVDSLTAFFSIGKKPSSSADPLSLRRAALGVVRILDAHRLQLDLGELFVNSAASLAVPEAKREQLQQELVAFIQERLRVFWTEAGFAAQQVRAVLAVAPTRVDEQRRRLQALKLWLADERGQQLAEIYKRINNICREAANAELRPMPESSESADAELLRVYRGTADAWRDADHEHNLGLLLELQQPLARFFNEVMVNSDDQQLREFRRGLLQAIRGLFLRVADFAELA